MMLNITIKTIPHGKQRYPTVGDWQTPVPTNRAGDKYIHHIHGRDGVLVSDMDNPDYEFLVAVHELCEMYLCKKHGVTDAAVTEFDIAYERARPPGDLSEPGDSPLAPYRREHKDAECVEKALAVCLGIDWDAYETALAVEKLTGGPPPCRTN